LKLQCIELLSSFAFEFNLRRYTMGHLAKCRAAVVDALPCTSTCSAAMVAMSTPCGGFIPRMEQGFSTSTHLNPLASTGVGDGAACSAALHAAQGACEHAPGGRDTGDHADIACERLLEATPESLHAEVATDHANDKLLWISWSEQRARGVVPKAVACGLHGQAHVDLRGNSLMGSVPSCVWAAARGNSQLYLSRNALSGTVGKLGAHVKHVHLNDNRLHGDLEGAVAHVTGVRILDVSGNKKLSGSLGFLRGKHELIHVDVHDNEFTDGAEEPVHAVLASLPYLHSYDISRNKWATAHAAPTKTTQITATKTHESPAGRRLFGGSGADAGANRQFYSYEPETKMPIPRLEDTAAASTSTPDADAPSATATTPSISRAVQVDPRLTQPSTALGFSA
jgi:hypothetical protein